MGRKVEVVVISDIHLGTYGCHAKEVLKYLNSVKPRNLVLNGDIIDIWQFRKSYFPKSHFLVIKKILALAAKGTKVYYITGNHDENLRKFSGTAMGNFQIIDKLVLHLDGKKAWFFHGDVFDASIQHAKWIAKLGGWGYDLLILLNRLINYFLVKMGREKYSLSKKIKNSVKSAVKFIDNFEKTATDLAIDNDFDYVVCGHIHQPCIRKVNNGKGSCTYLNSGDWIENLTALEYHDEQWTLYSYQERKHLLVTQEKEVAIEEVDMKDMIAAMRTFKVLP
ncbi:UDP-2,3-diacylglucosamine diphosphatase [Aequorivita echinoideorum]|uniref:UDP-2,3-diacylglucosamine diphosphatase n=1 Tax=Aequorivita echinoideorum TaxID=1549647 RepID=A0ABS5S658_9FLAO|nr:UDP-2,3-diacylglucosamine diphosphatase [Aequorivita echinoideorum]MBT0608702.1 UDP-2,3-diacylglucosamine diphosphatase [Aequorivita echinoideorum]